MYSDNIPRGVNYHCQLMDVLFSHMHIEHPPHMPQQMPYIPTWQELWVAGHDRFGTSGAQDEDEE